mmetsp:Transcript_30732/g.89806  ORF Transcript_30732/g.89806 Transcript_30732/m.89806 type:complete len:257 (-) Transcript_30732:735-1505(-)
MRTSSKSGRDAHTQMAWLSTCAVQRNSPPGETVIDVAAYSNEYQPMSAPDGTSTTRSVQSSADERTQRASAPHATSVSVFVCPSSRRTSRSATASITRTERSSAARATRVESRLWRSMPHAHPTSAVDCSLRAAGAHRRSVPSPPQEKRVRPSAAAARPRTAPSCRSSAAAAARGAAAVLRPSFLASASFERCACSVARSASVRSASSVNRRSKMARQRKNGAVDSIGREELSSKPTWLGAPPDAWACSARSTDTM